MKANRQENMRKAQETLDINNRDYANGNLSRKEWTAENRRIVAWCKENNLGITLQPFALED